MSNKLNIFSNSSKRKPANDEQQAAESAGQSDSGAASTAHKTGEHEQVVLDAWIETKVVSLNLIDILKLRASARGANTSGPW